jgi:23S rRNA (guanosine2251-2'-O)-methyltransferase
MPGNSPRPGRRVRPKKTVTGSGGRKQRAGLVGKGPTLPADERPWHKAYTGPDVPKGTARKQERELRNKAGRAARRPAADSGVELLVGRNPVVEALRAEIPATALYLARGIESDERVRELVRTAGDRGIAILEVTRGELDRLTGGAVHQGVGLQVPPYPYQQLEDLLPSATLLVALDGVTDPRNLGAVIRSAAAFGAGGVFLPTRRAAGITASAWRTSAGAAARLPVARVTNLTRALKTCQQEGYLVVGLDADADHSLYQLEEELADQPVVLVVGSEGRGLSRLVGATCDLRVAIPMASGVESLNASVAAAVALAEVARRRLA